MKDILNTVYLKHDTSYKSLTKRALSQILLKVVYESISGITTNSISAKIVDYTNVKIANADIDEAIRHLINEGKLNTKNGKHYIKNEYKPTIDKIVLENTELHKKVITRWFSKAETFQKEKGFDMISEWFSITLIKFFREYRYEWINDLRNKRISGKRQHFNVDKILAETIDKGGILEADRLWLKKQFIEFLESSENDDNSILWYYGLSSFSASLITARNYADDFSIELFKDSQFILDTNILIIIELEDHDLSYSFVPIAKVFEKLNIEPIYFYISKNEYQRAIAKKKTATLNSIEKFNFNVITESECPFIKTALKRGCRKREDFERFFSALGEMPKKFGDMIDIKIMDYEALKSSIDIGCNDDNVKTEIDKINIKRTKHSKSKNVLAHDSGLISGATYLRQNNHKCWILTRDGTIREYANEKIIRDDYPIAIGLDSFIQMMAINSGGIEDNSKNFAPLFAKIIQYSLLPDKDTFKVEDLYFIIETKINISELPDEGIVSIAKEVNKLRLKGKEDDEITLSIQRQFNRAKIDYQSKYNDIDSVNQKLKLDNERLSSNVGTLKGYIIQKEIAERKDKLDRKILLNWLSIIGVPCLIYALGYVAYRLLETSSSLITILIIPTLINLVTSLLMIFRLRIKLRRTNKDNLDIERQVLKEIDKL